MDRSARKGSLLLSRRQFCAGLLGGAAVLWAGCRGEVPSKGVYIPEVEPGEDLFGYIRRKTGGFDQALYQRVIGAANEYKEGDEILGVSAADEASRQNARRLLSNTRIGELHMRPLFSDDLYARLLTTVDAQAAQRTAGWTLEELRAFLLSSDEAAIKGIMVGLSSDTIGCVIKLMSNEDLIAVGKKVFNPLPGTQIGARGYMGARIQPNSPTDKLRAEGMREVAEVRKRGVPVAQGWGRQPWDLEPGLDREIRDLYADAKKSIWAEMTPSFKMSVPMAVMLRTGAADRMDYILHPANGERLDDAAREAVVRLRGEHAGRFNVQIVISEGLNAYAIMDEGHLAPYLMTLRQGLGMMGFKVAPENLLVTAGRVRAGYRIGEVLYGALADQEVPRGIIHVIGERPGSMHHTFSAYITAPRGKVWAETDRVDHNITKVVSGIADTALSPPLAAQETVRLLEGLWRLA